MLNSHKRWLLFVTNAEVLALRIQRGQRPLVSHRRSSVSSSSVRASWCWRRDKQVHIYIATNAAVCSSCSFYCLASIYLVVQCALAEMVAKGSPPDPALANKVASELTYFPKTDRISSVKGCKTIESKTGLLYIITSPLFLVVISFCILRCLLQDYPWRIILCCSKQSIIVRLRC